MPHDTTEHKKVTGWLDRVEAFAICACGWYRVGFSSRRAAGFGWQEHLDEVRRIRS